MADPRGTCLPRCPAASRNSTLHVSVLVTEPLLYCDKIYLYAKNLEQEKYQNLMKEINEASEEAGYNVMEVSNDKIIPITHLPYENNQKIIIFDDNVCEKNQREIVDYFIQGRHKNCSVIYLSQSFYKTPKDIRINCSHYIAIVFMNFHLQEREI